MLMDESWIFGKREKAQIQRSFMVDGRPLNFDIFINNSIIKMVDIYCDSLEINKVEK